MRKIIVRTYLLFNIKQFITRRPHIPQDPSLHYPKKGFYHQGPGHKGCHEVTALETFTLSTISLQHSSKAFYQGILFKQKSVQFNRGRGGDKWGTVLGGDVVQNKPEHVVLDEEGVSARLQDKVLHERLRRVVVSLVTRPRGAAPGGTYREL